MARDLLYAPRMRRAVTATSFLGLAIASLLTGCPDRTISEVNPEQGRVEYKDIPVTVNRAIDILFLIDDSPSMGDKQRNLGDNFPNFINVLNTIQGGLPDVHIGITTSDLGTVAENGTGPSIGAGQQGGCSGEGKGGKLQTYGAPVMGNFISDTLDTTGVRNKNYTGDLATVFAAMAKGAGVNGCGFEQHLEAVKHALDKTSSAAATNMGFLRAEAFLAVIIIADEDDCSMADKGLLGGGDNGPLGPLQSFRCTRYGITCDVGGTTFDEMNQIGPKSMCHSNESGTYLTKVQKYVDFLHGLKADPNSVIVALIGGPSTPVATESRAPSPQSPAVPALAHACNYTDGQGKLEVADPSVRQSQFINAFPNRSTFTTICQNDVSDGLRLIAELLKTVLGSPCIDGKLAMPVDCSVSDVSDPGKPDQVEKILKECTTTTNDDNDPNAPCWAIISDTMNCTGGDHVALRVKRNGQTPAPNTHVIANCVTEVTNGSGSGSN